MFHVAINTFSQFTKAKENFYIKLDQRFSQIRPKNIRDFFVKSEWLANTESVANEAMTLISNEHVYLKEKLIFLTWKGNSVDVCICYT